MTFDYHEILIFISVMLFIGVVLNKTAQRLGVPGLLIYLTIGIFIGNGGSFDFVYDFPEFTLTFSQLALSLIIFIGGLQTDFRNIRPVLAEGISLSTVAVVGSACLVGVFAHAFFDVTLSEGILLGAVISATDAAAVFSVIAKRKLKLKLHSAETLEFESGTNDPMALFLTLTITHFLAGGELTVGSLLLGLVLEMCIGAAAGLLVGVLAMWLIKKVKLEDRGLYPILLLSLALFLVGVVPLIHGNLLLAMYMAGIYIGSKEYKSERMTVAFFEGLSWMMELGLFVLLGLQVFPGEMKAYVWMSIPIALFLMVVARPASVLLATLPFKGGIKKKLFVSWAGLRGATPIAFALIPVIEGIPKADLIFNCVFVIVIFSVVIQMTTLVWVARKLKLTE
jgi:cell volume regulation protein A